MRSGDGPCFSPHAPKPNFGRAHLAVDAARREFQRSQGTHEMGHPPAPPPEIHVNSSEMAREVLHLKSALLNLDEENALLKREANALSERLTMLEHAYHGHNLWEWAGAFEVDAGEYDWTFIGSANGGYSGGVKWNDVVLMLDTTEELQALRPRAELLLSSQCEPVYGSTSRPVPRLRLSSTQGVCFRLVFDPTRDHTSFVIDCPRGGRLALFAQHALPGLGATRMLQHTTRTPTLPVANLSCCANVDRAMAMAEPTWEAPTASNERLFHLGALVALALGGVALVLSAVALVCARNARTLVYRRRDAPGGRPLRIPGEKQRPLEVAIPMTRMTVASCVNEQQEGIGAQAERSTGEPEMV